LSRNQLNQKQSAKNRMKITQNSMKLNNFEFFFTYKHGIHSAIYCKAFQKVVARREYVHLLSDS
jgi:hypothetical protein